MFLYESYSASLIGAGFTQATHAKGRFFKILPSSTALIVNLIDIGDEAFPAVYIVYGVTPVGEETHAWFRENGADNEECKIRHDAVIMPDTEIETGETIRACLTAYAVFDREAVRTMAKERQKTFLNRFHAVLKPNGYKRKGNTWFKTLSCGWVVELNAQKSAYSDQFYFNYAAYRAGEKRYGPAVRGRLGRSDAAGHQTDLFNWQLMSEEAVDALILQASRVLTDISERIASNK